MRKKYLFIAALVMPVTAFFMFSFSGGYTGSATGSPGDEGGTCTDCHAPGASFNAVAMITSDIPLTGYELNKSYTVTVSATSNSSKHGFQLCAETANAEKVGMFTAGTGSKTIMNNTVIGHNSSGNALKSWSFTWVSPATDKGEITFYGVVNATNGGGSNRGDQVVTTTKKIGSAATLGTKSFFASQFSLFPNPATDVATLQLPSNVLSADVIFHDHLGKNVKVQSVTAQQNKLDVTDLAKGIYYLTIKTAEGTATKTLVVN